jgi:DNA-binding Lrp family transcriptional regulator
MGERLDRSEVFTALERALLDGFQRDFPLSPTPFRDIAVRLGVAEDEVLTTLQRLQRIGVVSRVGPIIRPRRVGASTLAAMAVPTERMEAVAALVSSYAEVNHNYEREHRYNLWFVVTAENRACLQAVLAQIEARAGIAVLDLPLLEDYHIDLAFPLWS